VNEGTIVADGTPAELQQKFHGAESVVLELKAPVSNAMTEMFPKIKSLTGVESVEYGGASADVHRFTVFTAKGSDIREELFKQAVAEKWVLLELTRKGTSLEEVFHRLTTADESKQQERAAVN
jgi:ABC-type multidrug transport system ATPase subunit